jgi:hypothetical protein
LFKSDGRSESGRSCADNNDIALNRFLRHNRSPL